MGSSNTQKKTQRRFYYVYILRSQRFDRQLYYGFTRDLTKRLSTHNAGGVPSSARYKPWTLEFYAAFRTKKQAIQFEKYIKSGSGSAFVNRRLI